MYVFANVDEKGRLQLEKRVRAEVGIEPNTAVRVEVKEKTLVVRPAISYEEALKQLSAIRVPGSEKKTLRQMKEEARQAIVDKI